MLQMGCSVCCYVESRVVEMNRKLNAQEEDYSLFFTWICARHGLSASVL